MIRSLKHALQPAITDVSVLFQVPKEYEVLQCPHKLPPVFNGEKLVVYAVLKSKEGSTKKMDCTAVLNGNMLGGKQEHKVPFTLDSSAAAPSLPVVHHLAAKALIADWESEYKEKKSIVDLSIESSVISSHTAFIAIDEESSEPVSGAMKTYDIRAMPLRQSRMYRSPIIKCRLEATLGIPHEMEEKCYGALPECKKLKLDTRRRSYGMKQGASPRRYRSRSRSNTPPPRDIKICGLPAPLAMHCGSASADYKLMHSAAPDPCLAQRVSTNPLTSLVTAQQVNGSWALNASLAQLLRRSLHDLKSACPIEMKENVAGVWATVLAVSLLRARYSSQQDEWELIAMKAESWLKKQSLPPGCTLEQLFQAAQKLF